MINTLWAFQFKLAFTQQILNLNIFTNVGGSDRSSLSYHKFLFVKTVIFVAVITNIFKFLKLFLTNLQYLLFISVLSLGCLNQLFILAFSKNLC